MEDEKGGGVKVCVSKSEKKGSFLLSKVNRLNLVAKFIQWFPFKLKNGETEYTKKKKGEKKSVGLTEHHTKQVCSQNIRIIIHRKKKNVH